METPQVDSVELAEQEVIGRKRTAQAQYDALQAKLRNQASSPKVIGGVLVGAIALAYFVFGGRSKPKRRAGKQGGGTWSLMLETAQTLVPLFGALHAARQAKSAKKTIAKATGTAPVPHDAPVHEEQP